MSLIRLSSEQRSAGLPQHGETGVEIVGVANIPPGGGAVPRASSCGVDSGRLESTRGSWWSSEDNKHAFSGYGG